MLNSCAAAVPVSLYFGRQQKAGKQGRKRRVFPTRGCCVLVSCTAVSYGAHTAAAAAQLRSALPRLLQCWLRSNALCRQHRAAWPCSLPWGADSVWSAKGTSQPGSALPCLGTLPPATFSCLRQVFMCLIVPLHHCLQNSQAQPWPSFAVMCLRHCLQVLALSETGL